MTVALRSRVDVGKLIVVDNAPADVALNSEFGKYINAMQAAEKSHLRRVQDADRFLAPIEPVSCLFSL